MPASLTNLFVMVTRPSPAGLELCRLIETQGGTAFHFPTIEFVPADQATLQRAVAHLDEQEWLIFISPQAVYASVSAIRRAWPNMPSQVKFAAIGAGTAKALHAAGYQVSLQPEGEWNSEGLLNLPAFKQCAGKKIALVRGEGGRELLANTLSERGAVLTHLVAYQRIVPAIDVNPALNLLKDRKINIIVCASYESVRNLKAMLGDIGWSHLKHIPLLVMSERIKNLAQNLDFQTIWVVQHAANESIVAALKEKRNEICQIQPTN